jgi:signal transduction histidine kinase
MRSLAGSLAPSSTATAAPSAADARLLGDLRRRLIAWSALTTLAVLVILGGLFYTIVARAIEQGSVQQLYAQVDRLTVGRRAYVRDPAAPAGFQLGGPGSGTAWVVVGPGNRVLGPGISGLPVASGVTAARGGSADIRTADVSGTAVRVLRLPVELPDSSTAVLQVAQIITAEEQTLSTLRIVLVGGGLLALVAATLAGAGYASRALVPIRESLRRQREFAADASHELRTPLAVIRASVDELEQRPERRIAEAGPALGDIRAEVDHLAALVDDLLLLARSDSGAVALERLPVDLAGVAEESIAGIGGLAERAGVHVLLDPAPTPIVGDPGRLRQLVTILVDNAVRHSPLGGRVGVCVRPESGHAVLAVEDEGPGIRPDDLARVFDRFFRAEGEPPGGTGLGLAIAHWITNHHHGTIEASNRPGGGARFLVRLPLRT